MFYYLYKITNTLNNKIYVGVHKTKDINDGYMGSGRVIGYAIKKYGIVNFQKVILESFNNSKDMYAREKEVVTESFLAREDVYNLRVGGYGGFDYINRNPDEQYINTRRENGRKYNFRTRPETRPLPKFGTDNFLFGKRTQTNFSLSPDIQKKAAIRALSDASRNKRKETLKKINHSQGDKNSQFGTIWITNGIENKKIKKDTLILEGWIKGRIKGNTSSGTINKG